MAFPEEKRRLLARVEAKLTPTSDTHPVEVRVTPTPTQKLYYLTILMPMWRNQLEQLGAAEREYRHISLAVACLERARGPGTDPVLIADLCRKWEIPMTLPFIGPTHLLRKIGKAVGAAPSQADIFDPTQAIAMGTRVLAKAAPLFERIQMRGALLNVLDEKIVPPKDQSSVGSIIESSSTPSALTAKFKESKTKLELVWRETVSLAEKMEPIRNELGRPPETN